MKYFLLTLILTLSASLADAQNPPNNMDPTSAVKEDILKYYNNEDYDNARILLEKNLQFAWCQNILGIMYCQGYGVKQDSSRGVELFTRAAKSGLPTAQYNLGRAYEQGDGVEKNVVIALEWYKKASEQNYPLAFYAIGALYEFGNDVNKDAETAYKWFREGASLGSDACENALDVDRLRRDAIKGDAEAQYLYAVKLDDKKLWTDSNSVSEAIDWLKSSADKGYGRANGVMALVSASNKDFASADNYLAESGDSSKRFQIGYTKLISINGIKALVKYLKNNPGVSITNYGPTHNDAPFLFERNDTVYVCASNKGKAGLLKLDKVGNRICHDEIPLAYNYIVPVMHEFLPFIDLVDGAEDDICFIISPYIYTRPRTEDGLRALDMKGNETEYSTYSSKVSVIETPDGFVYDSDRGSYIE